MPPWITSLLREDTPLPMPLVASATITSWPLRAAARATASPTTPAPTTRTCISCVLAVDMRRSRITLQALVSNEPAQREAFDERTMNAA